MNRIPDLLFAAAVMVAGLLVLAEELRADQGIRVVTSEFPPYSYSAGNQPEGIAVDLVTQLLEAADVSGRIEVFPWARAYEIAKRQPGTLIFLIARTPEREHEFEWIGRLMDFEVKLFRLKNRADIDVKAPNNLHAYKVGSLISDVKGEYLKSMGIETIRYATEESGIHMLKRGYIDLMPAEINSFHYRVRRLGYSDDDFEEAWDLEAISRPLYIAFSKGTPPEQVEHLRRTLEHLSVKLRQTP